MCAPSFRPVFVQVLDRYDRPLIGAEIELHGAEGRTSSFRKSKRAPTRVEVSSDQNVTVVARYGKQEERRVVAVDARESIVRFRTVVFPPTVLIVCAKSLEAAAVLATCESYEDLTTGGPPGDPNVYRVGSYMSKGNDPAAARLVLVAISGMGTSNAAIVATHALRSFWTDIRHIIMVGIAGGCPSPGNPHDHVRLGDIVAADKRGIVQYDYVKRYVDRVEYRDHPQRPSAEMLQAAEQLDTTAILEKPVWERWLDIAIDRQPMFARPPNETDVLHDNDREIAHPFDPRRKTGRPNLFRGAIGTANILLKDPLLRDRVRDDWGVRAIEMEGSGILDAGWAMNTDVMVVRGICDYCDSHKNDRWQPYAALCAAAYARSLVEVLPEGLLRPKAG